MARTPSRRARLDEAPQAPWGRFPLAELCVLVGAAVAVLGFLSEGDRRPSLILAGLGLASLAGLELSVREHLAGYRSHSAVLALVAAFVAGGLVWVLTEDRALVLVAAALTWAAAFGLLRRAFAKRSGGLGWRA